MALSIERELLERACSRDGSAIESLIAIVWPEAYRLAVSILRDRGLAEDAAQDACAAIAASLHSLKSLEAFPAWSYRIIVSHALGASRTRQRTVRLDEAAWLGAGLDGTDALALHEALTLLSPLQRATVLLYYYAGYNSAEIAAVMGLAASSVRFHLMRARSTLRKALSETAECRSDREVFSDVR